MAPVTPPLAHSIFASGLKAFCADAPELTPFFPLIPRGLWLNDFLLMILNESAPEGLVA